METKPAARRLVLALPWLSLIPLGRGAPDAASPGLQRQAVPAPTADYAVHEWGTFTSVLDGEGRPLRWNPFALVAPLPGFVHRGTEPKVGAWGTVRLETPVLYFHAAEALSVDVRVAFPGGRLSEWYPAAEGGGEELAWRGLDVLPGLDATLPTGLAGEEYYAARGVQAAPVHTRSGEEEGFLFYRGVGSFEQPLAVRIVGAEDERSFELENLGEEPVEGVLLFERRGGRAGLLEAGTLAAGAVRRIPTAALALVPDVSLVRSSASSAPAGSSPTRPGRCSRPGAATGSSPGCAPST